MGERHDEFDDSPAGERTSCRGRRAAGLLVVATAAAWPVASWAAQVAALAPPPMIDPAPVVAAAARDAVTLYRTTHRVGYGVTIPDGYLDGGRGMEIGPDGRAGSSREVLVVDRERDEVLAKAVAFAASPAVRSLPTSERMRRIAHYVSSTFGPRPDRVTPFADDEALANACRGRGVLVGAVPGLCNTGVCRHQALFYKLMADEAGLDAALVRGGYRNDGRDWPGAHAWCEVEQDDGSVVVVDTMGSNGWFVTMADSRAARYHDVAGRPLYGPAGRRQHLAIVAVGGLPFVDKAVVRLVSPEQGDHVRYTLDGSEPTAAAPLADGPLSIPATCVIKAAAFAADGSVEDRASRLIVVIPTRRSGGEFAPPAPAAN